MLLLGQQPEEKLPVLDWTGPPPPPKGTFGFPGDSAGGAPGLKPKPRYRLPLKLTIRSVEPRSIARGQKLVIELLVQNIGSEPYYLPVARNDGTVHAQGNKQRRVWFVDIRLHDVRGGPPVTRLCETTAGSVSAPTSLLRLGPSTVVTLRFESDARVIASESAEGSQQYGLSVVCGEWTSKNEVYFIQGRSEEVESTNRIPHTVLPK